MNIIIEIENLTKDYETGFLKKKKIRALGDLSLQVKAGQIFGFLGGNGAGKTTTIKLLMRLLFPTSGTAKILGSDISDVKIHSRVGYCPENPYFYDYLSAAELMNYFGEIFGIDAAKRKQKTEELLTKVGLDEKDWNKHLRKFSKGMLQRVGIAQSLINDPEIVFLDEPMSGLDPIGRREVRELITGLRENGTTVFMSTHILSDVEAICDEVAILRRGKLAATGNLDDLLARGGEQKTFEIIVTGVGAEVLQSELPAGDATVSDKGNGLSIQVFDENNVEKVLPAVRKTGGHLVSIQSVKQSLEDIFVEQTTGPVE